MTNNINLNNINPNNNELSNNIYIVFVEAETPGNIGFLARAMANFGLKNLVLINPCELKDESYYQASHGRYIVDNAMICENLDKFLDNTQIDTIIGSTASPGGSYNLSRIAVKINELTNNMNSNGKIAILFGREGNGLSNNEIDLCDIIISIPTDPNYPVMNISHAAAIVFYEIFKTTYNFPKEGLELATSIEKDYLINDINNIIKGFNLPKHKEKTNLKAFKNIINRAFLTGREAHTLKGLFRKINLKLNNSEDNMENNSDDK